MHDPARRDEFAARMSALQAGVREDLGGRVVAAEEVVEQVRAVLAEDREIARVVRERTAAGPATPLQESATKLGIDLGSL